MTIVNHFKQEMSHTSADLLVVKVYLDGIIIYSYSIEINYVNKLSAVSQFLEEYNLKVKDKNVNFAK